MPEPKKETVSPVVQETVAKGKTSSPKPQNAGAAPPAAPGATPGVTPPASPPAKKPLGQKEIIPFEWKLVGESHGVILTLFKAVDRLEVEAQEERVRKDGYYGNLRILDANAKIKQRKQVAMVLKAQKKTTKSSKAARSSSKTKAKLPARFVSIKRTPKPDAPAKKTKRKTKTAKATVKKTKKKAAPKKTKAVRKKASTSSPKKKTTKKAAKKTTKKVTKKRKKRA